MTRRLIAGAVLLALAGCELPASDGGVEAREEAGPATDLVDDMAGRGRLPQRDYVCVLTGEEAEAQPYGTLGVANTRYTLVLKGGGRREGEIAVDAERVLSVEGDLAVIGGEARRVTGGRVNSDEGTVELAFGFNPAEDGRDRIVCTAEA